MRHLSQHKDAHNKSGYPELDFNKTKIIVPKGLDDSNQWWLKSEIRIGQYPGHYFDCCVPSAKEMKDFLKVNYQEIRRINKDVYKIQTDNGFLDSNGTKLIVFKTQFLLGALIGILIALFVSIEVTLHRWSLVGQVQYMDYNNSFVQEALSVFILCPFIGMGISATDQRSWKKVIGPLALLCAV